MSPNAKTKLCYEFKLVIKNLLIVNHVLFFIFFFEGITYYFFKVCFIYISLKPYAIQKYSNFLLQCVFYFTRLPILYKNKLHDQKDKNKLKRTYYIDPSQWRSQEIYGV